MSLKSLRSEKIQNVLSSRLKTAELENNIDIYISAECQSMNVICVYLHRALTYSEFLCCCQCSVCSVVYRDGAITLHGTSAR